MAKKNRDMCVTNAKDANDFSWEDVWVAFQEKCVQDIRCGFSFNAALTDDAHLYTWGLKPKTLLVY
jgi:alpha-tubulin suppressor-like RCC1 family protein